MRYRDTGDYQNLGVPVDDNFVFLSILWELFWVFLLSFLV